MLLLIYEIDVPNRCNLPIPYCAHSNSIMIISNTVIPSTFKLSLSYFKIKNLVSFVTYIKRNTFTFIVFTLFGTHIRAYGSSIALQFPPHLLTLTVNE